MENTIQMVCIDRNYLPVVGTRLKIKSPHFIVREWLDFDEEYDELVVFWGDWVYYGGVEYWQAMHPTLGVSPLHWHFRKVTESGYELGCDPEEDWLAQRPLLECDLISDDEARVEYVFIPEQLKNKLSNNKK